MDSETAQTIRALITVCVLAITTIVSVDTTTTPSDVWIRYKAKGHNCPKKLYNFKMKVE